MRLFGCGALLVCFGAASALAQEATFPYQGIVQSEEYVRSGPGRLYYPTGKLRAGDRVTIHRHDPGGWYMIAPPPGSFSWIPARYVDRHEGERGTVNENNVVVRVGSFQSDIRDVEQRRLNKGDSVHLLGEKTFQTEKGLEAWYQIAPPKGEYRWMMGKFVAPAQPRGNSPGNPPGKHGLEQPPAGPIAGGAKARENRAPRGTPHKADPFEVEEIISADTHRADPFEQSRSTGAGQKPRGSKSERGEPVLRTGPTASELAADRQKVKDLDIRLSLILEQEAGQWNFEALEQNYQQLRQELSEPALRYLIESRLAAIGEYKQIKRDYADFVKLTSQTTQREMQLLSIQQNQQAPVTARKPIETPAAAPALPPETSPSTPPVRPGTSRFEGAGIIQRSATTYAGAPRYVLLAPNGRVLAYLRADAGVDLERAVGQSMGLNGPRTYDQNLRADLMIVRQMTPVRLAP